MVIIILFWDWKYRSLDIHSFGTNERGKPKLRECYSFQIKAYFITNSSKEG